MFDRITNFETLKSYTLRKLGHGAIRINVTDEQITDRMYDAIEMFCKYHYDGFRWDYLILPIISGTIEYELDKDILDVIEILTNIDTMVDDPTINIRWEFYEDKVRSGNIDLIGFEALQQKLDLIDFKLRRQTTYTFNFSTNTIKFYSLPDNISYVALKVFKINDPEDYTGILNNEWLRDYFKTLLQIQWAENLTKYTSVPLPGGSQLNMEAILERGLAEKERLETKLKNEFEEPIDIMTG